MGLFGKNKKKNDGVSAYYSAPPAPAFKGDLAAFNNPVNPVYPNQVAYGNTYNATGYAPYPNTNPNPAVNSYQSNAPYSGVNSYPAANPYYINHGTDKSDSEVFMTFDDSYKGWICRECATRNSDRYNGCAVCGLPR